MAGHAQTILDRLMFCHGPFLALYRVRMAAAAEFDRLFLQQALVRRRMRIVAVQTAVFADDRPMEPVLGEHVIDHIVVAAPAELKALFLEREGLGGGGAFMTLAALLAFEWLMGRIVDDPSVVRTVHVVAHRALAVSHRIVSVLFDENGLVRIVALLAESRNFITQ